MEMRESAHSMASTLRRCLKEMHDIRQRRIRTSSAKSNYCQSGRRGTLRSTRNKVALTLLTLTCLSMIRIKTPTKVRSIYRMLTHCDPSIKTSRVFRMDRSINLQIPSVGALQPIIARRDPPSHIILCQELLNRRKATQSGLPIKAPFSLQEDESVCTDWSAPHASLLEIMASTVVAHVAAKYNVVYQHNCGTQSSPESSDGLDWTTIQQIFPVSSLVLDNNSIKEKEIADLCLGCVNAFVAGGSSARTNKGGNPVWYDPTETHHCIFDPKTSQSIDIDTDGVDLEATPEQVYDAQQHVVNRVFPSMVDRFRLAAAEQKLESSENYIEDDGPQFARSRGNAEDSVRPNSSRDIQDVIIYIEKETLHLSDLQFDQYIPPSATSICIHLHPLCAATKICAQYGADIHTYLAKMHTSAEVTLDMIASTAEAYSNMVTASYLICPPGTTACLIPAMVKEEGTFAIVGESPDRSNTYNYFIFMSDIGPELQVAKMNVSLRARGSQDDDDDDDNTAESFQFPIPLNYEDPILLDGTRSSDGGFRDGCNKARGGNLGSWEKDFSYESLTSDKAGTVRGRSNNVSPNQSSNRYTSGIFHDMIRKQDPDGTDDQLMTRSAGRYGDDLTWAEQHPECDLELLNLRGLCEVMETMQLTVMTFTGDMYTQVQVKKFLDELGVLDGSFPEITQPTGQKIPTFRQYVECPTDVRGPTEPYNFDIVFTPNKNLVPTEEADQQEDNAFPNVLPSTNGGTQSDPSWFGDPYGDPNDFTGNPRSSTVPTGYPPAYSNNCGCVPFMNQYYSNIQTQPVVTPQQPFVIPQQPVVIPQQPVVIPQPLPPKNQNLSPFIAKKQPRSIQYQYSNPTQYQYSDPRTQYFPGQTQQLPQQQLPQQLPPQQLPPQQLQQPFQMQNRQVIVAGMNQNQSYEDFCRQYDAFGGAVSRSVNPNDIVFMRSGVPPHGSCACQQCNRRTEEEKSMTVEEIQMANEYMAHTIDQYRRRTRQTDLLNYNPIISQKPQIHILDVSHMSSSHPHAKASTPENDHGRKLCQAQGWNTAPQVKWWNNMLYSNLKDMARAEMAAQAGPQVQYQPQYFP